LPVTPTEPTSNAKPVLKLMALDDNGYKNKASSNIKSTDRQNVYDPGRNNI